MRIPKKLKIGGHTYTVKFDPERDNLGYCDSVNNIININKKAVQTQQEATLIHEIFHAINTTFDSGHNFSHSLLDSLSEQFYQVLKENKLLRK